MSREWCSRHLNSLRLRSDPPPQRRPMAAAQATVPTQLNPVGGPIYRRALTATSAHYLGPPERPARLLSVAAVYAAAARRAVKLLRHDRADPSVPPRPTPPAELRKGAFSTSGTALLRTASPPHGDTSLNLPGGRRGIGASRRATLKLRLGGGTVGTRGVLLLQSTQEDFRQPDSRAADRFGFRAEKDAEVALACTAAVANRVGV